MIALWIILGILALLCAILFIDVAVVLNYDKKLRLTLYVFGIPLNLLSLIQWLQRPKKEKKAKEKVAEEPSPAEEKRSFEDFFGFLLAIGRTVKSAAKSLSKHLRIRLLFFEFIVANEEDAAKTALNFGRINAAFYSLASVLELLCRFTMNEKRVLLKSNYQATSCSLNARVRFRIKPVFLISLILSAWRGFTTERN